MISRPVTVALLALLLGIVPATAEAASAAVMDSTTQATLPAALQHRLAIICARVPNLIKRTDNLTARLPAGPDTAGSIAWIKDRANKANARGRAQIATDLNNRANVLTQKLAILPNQKAKLTQIQAKCQQLGVSG